MMRITKSQIKTFNRINEKLKSNKLFFITNYGYLMKVYSYLKKRRCIVKRRLKLKNRNVVILFNQLKKNGLNTEVHKTGRKRYSKKLRRKCRVLNKSEKKSKSTKTSVLRTSKNASAVDKTTKALKETIEEVATTSADEDKIGSTRTGNVTDLLREQIKLLQSGQRSSIPLLKTNTAATSVTGTKNSSCNSTPSFSRQPSHSSVENETINSTDSQSKKRGNLIESSPNISSQKPNFIDSLISKLKTQGLSLPSNDESQSLSAHTSPEKPLLVANKFSAEGESDVGIDNGELSDHSTSSKNDFHGFKEIEAQFERPNIPGMLPTPVVRKSKGVESAFVSEELDNFMKENALDNSAYTTAPLKKRHDEAMMYAEAEPPSLLCPQLPSDVEKPRTVAEKRQLLEQKADIKYLMIENESTVYRELKKRARTGPVPNYTLIRNIQQMNIPFTRDCWRATCWLNTPNGRFYYQTIQDNDKEIKVLGGRGNNNVKELVKLQPVDKKLYVHQECTKGCKLIGNIKVNGLEELIMEQSTSQSSEITHSSKKLNTLADDYSFQKPGPLSKKKLNPIKSSVDIELGPLELYNLPVVQLQVKPRLDRPLPDFVQPYLMLALPSDEITKEWAQFAASTLKLNTPLPSRRKRKRYSHTVERQSFSFSVPYTNDQSRILIRKRRKIGPALTKLSSIDETETTQLSFMKDVDRSDNVAVVVADALNDMINSVALTLCEATVIRDDPDIDYNKVDVQVQSGDKKLVGINAIDVKKRHSPAGKVVKELKKLNAKIIHGYETIDKECKNAFCQLGCVCDSLRGAQTYSYHCKEVNCMFECKCPSSKINTSTFESAVHNSDIKQFCDRMNASLAKEEKDFTATVVVSDGKTIYVPTWDEKKKRLKKVPKRLSDCVQFESDFIHRDMSDALLTKQEKRKREQMDKDVIDANERALISNKNDYVKSMVHVNVNVERQSALDVLQPWCMVHCLYKCFCRLRATEGHRFEFGNTKINDIEPPIYMKRRQYTFEQNEPVTKTVKYTNCMSPTYQVTDYNDFSTCRRVRVVATNKHKIVNRARSEDIRRRIKKIEQDHPGLNLLLKNRVKSSIAMAEITPQTVTDSYRNNKRKPKENPPEVNESRHSMNSDPLEQPDDNGSDSSINIDENCQKYRSRFNNIIMKTMQGISRKLKSMIELPSPVNKAFYYMQWKYFLEGFNADLLYIWEVQLNSEEFLLVATDKNIMPIVANAMYVINIKALSTERLPLLPKLIKHGLLNDETEKLSILLFGVSNYWRVLGCTHSENDFMNERVVAVPTPDANPRLASKISYLFNDMVKWTAKNRSKELPAIKSNLCIRELDPADVNNIHVPIPVIGCHRWLMLSLANDFSHIFVPSWRQLITQKKIFCALDHANKAKKTVRMGPVNMKPHVYVPPNSDMKIFFGPMKKNESLDLQMLQESDGKMLRREEYQLISKRNVTAVTFGTWLYMKDDIMVVGNKRLDAQIRTYPPPKLKLLNKASPAGFIPLKPSTVTSNNLNVTLMPDTSLEMVPCIKPSTSTASSTAPSSELIRHLSLGLRARPAKVDTSPIKVVDTSLLMSPQFLATSSQSRNPESSPNYTIPESKKDQIIPPKPITLSFQPNTNSQSNWKDISKGVPIQGRRFTTFMPTGNKPTLKSLLQKPLVAKTLTKVESSSNVATTSKPNPPGSIRERRYTTIVSTGLKPLFKNPSQNARPPVNVKNFELIQTHGNKLTLAPIPVTESVKLSTLNRPVLFKKVEAVNLPTTPQNKSKSIDQSDSTQVQGPSSPSKKQTIVQPKTSAIPLKLSTPPVIVVKPSSFNLNLPKTTPTAAVPFDGRPVIMKKLPALRLLPPNVNILGKNKSVGNITATTEAIDSEDETSQLLFKNQVTASTPKMSACNNTVNGYLISQIRDLGKIMAKKLFAAYSVNLVEGSKLFHTFKNCTDHLNNVYIKERIFAMVPAHLAIEWKFVAHDEDHTRYKLHDERTLRRCMVLTRDELIDLNSDFDTNERFSLDLRHHLLVLRLAYTCMKNYEARNKTGLEIVRKSEAVIKEMVAENTRLVNCLSALRIEQQTKVSKISELRQNMLKPTVSDEESSEPIVTELKDEVITIDSDDD